MTAELADEECGSVSVSYSETSDASGEVTMWISVSSVMDDVGEAVWVLGKLAVE